MTDPLWITYAWVDNEEGDFNYLVQELEKAGIHTLYDRISLVPGRRLWAQISERITSHPLSGWGYLLTSNSLASLACQEELSYALKRALATKGNEFPLIGLLHKVSIHDVPMALRVRLCVDLTNPDWIEEVRAGVYGVPPHRALASQDPFVVKIHKNYLGQPGAHAIEVRPRFGEITYWRLAFPSNGPQPIRWGVGPANGGGISGRSSDVIEGEYSDIEGAPMKFYGAADRLTASISSYAVFVGELPEKMFFGVAKEPFAIADSGSIIRFRM
jgi:hypothetical protein